MAWQQLTLHLCLLSLQLHLSAPNGQISGLSLPSHLLIYNPTRMCVRVSLSQCSPGAMFSRRWRFGWDSYSEVDLFTTRYDTSTETLSQAIQAAASEGPDADGSVLFGHLRGTVVGLKYYTGVVRISLDHFYPSAAWIHTGDKKWVQYRGCITMEIFADTNKQF